MASNEALLPGIELPEAKGAKTKRKNGGTGECWEPPNLGKAIRMNVPDFSDPDRPLTCLEVDFPLAPVNALAIPESTSPGVRRRPEYSAMKWFARRGQSVFRSMLIAAGSTVPDDPTHAARTVWDAFYANHSAAGSFKKLRVLDPFMGGGTTLVEAVRLGFQVTGIDLNPVAWFICRNELACSDSDLLDRFFDEIESALKPQIQPFYATTCPRGHKGRWFDTKTGDATDVDPLTIPPGQRTRYRWEGPDALFTFWVKHGPCKIPGCGHRTPILGSHIVSQKALSRFFIPATCPSCKTTFNIELGETRMAPGVDRIVLDSEPQFTEANQDFAQLLKEYDKGNSQEVARRTEDLLQKLAYEQALCCPECGTFAAHELKKALQRHQKAKRAADVKKKHFGIKRGKVQMWLLINPDWLEGAPGFINDEQTHKYGGYAGAPVEDTVAWFQKRLEALSLIEVRGDNLPDEIELPNGVKFNPNEGTVPGKSKFRCMACGPEQDILKSVKPTQHTAPVAAYMLQCYCPMCDSEGYNYNGRYFKAVESVDVSAICQAEREWDDRKDVDLKSYWPREECWDAYMMRANGGVNDGWGYTHWWKMFNPRQLLVHTQLLKQLIDAPAERWPLDIREQALGAFQQYLRNHCMFAFWHRANDVPVPHMSNDNYHPKQATIENNFAGAIGYGNWRSCARGVVAGLRSTADPWESVPIDGETRAEKVYPGDAMSPGLAEIHSRSATDLTGVTSDLFDLVITDPPFGNNVFYADLADFFYVWLRIPLLVWYRGLPERAYFEPNRTPHAAEAVDNKVEHPDDREEWERNLLVTKEDRAQIRLISEIQDIDTGQANPLYRPEPSSEFYCNTLTAAWAEAGRFLKPSGLLAFTFHHSQDAPWIDVLRSLFDAGYFLVATYPVRSDNTKGEAAAFGSKLIEYDIVHVCRKRLEEPEPVAWAKMRRWVKDEAIHLRNLLEHSHGKNLPESDVLVILRGKALEFYSRHYGEVYTGDGQVLSVGEALLGINLLLDDLVAGDGEEARKRPPEAAEPASRLYLRVFTEQDSIPRDELHKTLRGTEFAQANLEARGWIRVQGTTVLNVPVIERFQYFTAPGRNRRALKSDLDQAHFLIGAAMGPSGVNITGELNGGTWTVKRSVDPILTWYAEMDPDGEVRQAAKTASGLVTHWRSRPKVKPVEQLTLFDQLEAEED